MGAAAVVAGGLAAGWGALVAVQGNCRLEWETDGVLDDVSYSPGRACGRVVLANRGRQGGTVYRVDGRLVSGPARRVLVSRAGSRPHEPGWWVSNVLKPGESCVVEVGLELDDDGAEGLPAPVVVELDAQELGRRLIVHRTVQLTVPADPPAPA